MTKEQSIRVERMKKRVKDNRLAMALVDIRDIEALVERLAELEDSLALTGKMLRGTE